METVGTGRNYQIILLKVQWGFMVTALTFGAFS